jgi:hypothetical protein
MSARAVPSFASSGEARLACAAPLSEQPAGRRDARTHGKPNSLHLTCPQMEKLMSVLRTDEIVHLLEWDVLARLSPQPKWCAGRALLLLLGVGVSPALFPPEPDRQPCPTRAQPTRAAHNGCGLPCASQKDARRTVAAHGEGVECRSAFAARQVLCRHARVRHGGAHCVRLREPPARVRAHGAQAAQGLCVCVRVCVCVCVCVCDTRAAHTRVPCPSRTATRVTSLAVQRRRTQESPSGGSWQRHTRTCPPSPRRRAHGRPLCLGLRVPPRRSQPLTPPATPCSTCPRRRMPRWWRPWATCCWARAEPRPPRCAARSGWAADLPAAGARRPRHSPPAGRASVLRSALRSAHRPPPAHRHTRPPARPARAGRRPPRRRRTASRCPPRPTPTASWWRPPRARTRACCRAWWRTRSSSSRRRA